MKTIYITTLFYLVSAFCMAQTGITWNAANDISMTMYDNMHPRIAMDRAGNPLVIWGKLSDQSVYFSRWNGTSFTTPVRLNPMSMSVATADWMGPDIAAHGDTVYVVVKRTPEVADTNRIFIFTSMNGGVSFNSPVELAFIADSLSRFPTVTTDDTGNPIVAFMKFNSVFLDSRWVVSRSSDYGNTFTTDVKASGWGGSSEVCDCCPGAVVSNGNTSVMLYRNNDNNLRDIWAGYSNDNANTFSTGFAVDNNNWMIMSCPSTGPDGIIIGDTLYTVFMNGGGGTARTYLSKTEISSGTLSSVNQLSNVPGLTLQNFPRIAGDGNAMAIVWRQVVNGIAELPILFTNNISNGMSSVNDTVDLGNVTSSDVALSNGKIAVVWQDDNSGTVKYRTGTYIPSGTSLSEIEKDEFTIFPNPVADYLTFNSGTIPVNSEVTILNVLGEPIYFRDNFNTGSIEVSGLNRGIYFIRITAPGKSFSRKFIKD